MGMRRLRQNGEENKRGEDKSYSPAHSQYFKINPEFKQLTISFCRNLPAIPSGMSDMLYALQQQGGDMPVVN